MLAYALVRVGAMSFGFPQKWHMEDGGGRLCLGDEDIARRVNSRVYDKELHL
jgi:hypothetical protein